MMRILIVAATRYEVQPIADNLSHYRQFADIQIMVTGIGSFSTTYALTKVLCRNTFDLVLNLGVAGSYNPALRIGQVVKVETDLFGDFLIEDGNTLTPIHLTDWMQSVGFPNKSAVMKHNCPFFPQLPLEPVEAITCNTVHGNPETIDAMMNLYAADIESMEGAAFYYTCLKEKVRCLQIRAVSNYVEPRDKSNWDTELAIENLSRFFHTFIAQLPDYMPDDSQE